MARGGRRVGEREDDEDEPIVYTHLTFVLVLIESGKPRECMHPIARTVSLNNQKVAYMRGSQGMLLASTSSC